MKQKQRTTSAGQPFVYMYVYVCVSEHIHS